MNKNKQKILMYAEVSRKLSEIQTEYVKSITDELLKIHPDLNELNPEDGAENWAYDVINATDNQGVVETLERLENILYSKRSSNSPLLKEEVLNIKVKELTDYINKLEKENMSLKLIFDSNY